MIQYTFPFDFILSLRILPMNIMLFLSLFTFLHANNNIQGSLDIDLRQRIVNDNQIRIVVQVDNNSKRDIKTIFRTLSQLEKESLERKKSIGLNLIKEVIQNS